MNIRTLFLCAAFLAAATASPPALSQVPSDREQLLSGAEGGEIRAAEASYYPGPKRALDLEKDLHLTDPQKKAIRAIADETRARAVELGKRIVGVEEELNDAFRTGMVSEQSVRDDAEQIGRLRGRLRAVFLTAHLKTRKILTSEQLVLYKNLKSQPQGSKK